VVKRITILGICITICVIVITACAALPANPMDDRACAGLFQCETPLVDSGFCSPHVPPEAVATSPLYVTPQPTATPLPEVDCLRASGELPVERVDHVPESLKAFFQLSPTGRYIAIQQYTEDRLIVLDQETGEHREFTASGVPFFWTDETHLFMSDSTSQSGSSWYSINTDSGEITSFESRWEYEGPELARLTRELYTGWQAAWALQVPNEVVCNAVLNDTLHAEASQDGSLLLHRGELLERGVEIVRDEYNELISPQQIARLRESAGNAVVIERFWIDAPLERGYENRTWRRLLILFGLPEEPWNLIVHVASESHWADYPLIPNQHRIAGRAIRNENPLSDYFVSSDLCTSDAGESFVLFESNTDNGVLTALGRIPYQEYMMYNQDGNWSQMVWSPTADSIYIDEWLNGQYRIYRLKLPSD
jgi:hypothetical protein